MSLFDNAKDLSEKSVIRDLGFGVMREINLGLDVWGHGRSLVSGTQAQSLTDLRSINLLTSSKQ